MTCALSCYTANLDAYQPDAPDWIARTVRLAVRTDSPRPEFSHHAVSLSALPDGGHLAYRWAATVEEALAGIEHELRRHGRVLVVVDSARLHWTPGGAHGGGHVAIRWLLLDDRSRERWHVVDRFAALLPEGEQRPHTGWITTAELAGALAVPARPSERQRTRDTYAFGFPVVVPPAGHPRWLVREDAPTPVAELPGSWAHGPAALEVLARWFGAGPGSADCYEDLWTAGRHHEHQLAWHAATGRLTEESAEEQAKAWRALVRSVRFALDSARRGRPRSSLIAAAFQAVAATPATGDRQ
ncbi:hypothetical protein AB0L41_24090 [Amycolatopsis mediterranei]|uniref:hypothetical protein n=1 Tax=Amycolatopsis mediterranei TaxID=33910 RepID=UPI003439DC8D